MILFPMHQVVQILHA